MSRSDEQTLFCWDCKQTKPAECFPVLKNGRRYSYCKECTKRHKHEAHQRRKQERNYQPAPEKLCPGCKQVKSSEHFRINKICKDGLSYSCKICESLKRREHKEYVRHSEPKPSGPTKCCHRCKTVKDISEFHRNRARLDHLDVYCRSCSKAMNHPRYIKHTYGLSADDYASLLAKQGGLCAICRKPESVAHMGKTPRLSVDHCHQTKKIRGLLCYACNHLVGYLERFGPEGVAKAVEYLKQQESQRVTP